MNIDFKVHSCNFNYIVTAQAGFRAWILDWTPTATPEPPDLPTCIVTIRSDEPVFGYETPFDVIQADTENAIDITGMSGVGIIERWIVVPNIVRAIAESDEFWFYSGRGNVSTVTEGDCNDLPIETMDSTDMVSLLQDNYGVLLRHEGSYIWTDVEIQEIYSGVIATATSFALLSDSELTPPELFRFIMTDGDVLPYIVLYKGVTNITISSLEPEAGQKGLLVTFDIPDPTGTDTLPISFEKAINDGGCITVQGTGSTQQQPSAARPRTIACNSLPIVDPDNRGIVLAGVVGLQENLAFTQYLLVHELGHIFDNRTSSTNCGPTSSSPSCRLLNLAFQGVASGNCPTFLRNTLRVDANATRPPNSPSLEFNITCVDVVDLREFWVMGRPRGVYTRLDRGWGTGPDSIFSDFQQHPVRVFASDPPELILEEEAADMFLNWVYRTISDIPTQGDEQFTFLKNAPGNWQGFRNQSWDTVVQGNDDRYPGDARLEWMHIVMKAIFDEKGW